jgi:hypothetical protein
MHRSSPPRRVRRAVAAGATSLALVALAACGPVAGESRASDTVEKSLSTQVQQVRVEMFNGPISVTPGPAGTVAGTVTRTGVGGDAAGALSDAQKIDVTLEETGGEVVLRAVYGPSPQSPGSRSAGAVVTVPAGATLILLSSNGPITLGGLTGTILAHTSNAPISVTGRTTALRAQTSNGTITVRDGAGLITVETSNAVADVAADATVLDATTSNGKVSFAGSLGRGLSQVTTSNADVDITLPRDASFAFDASTSGGTVTTGFAVAGATSDTDTRLAGTVGQGSGTSLVIVTSNGNVRIQAAP